MTHVRIASLMTFFLVLAACSNSSSNSASQASASSAAASGAPAAPAGKTIGVSIQNREAQFYQDMEAGMRAEAAKFGYKLLVVDANRDNAKQQSQVEDFISKKVDAIVLTPYDSQAIGSAIVEANDAVDSGIYRRHRQHEQSGQSRRRTLRAITCRVGFKPAN